MKSFSIPDLNLILDLGSDIVPAIYGFVPDKNLIFDFRSDVVPPNAGIFLLKKFLSSAPEGEFIVILFIKNKIC